MNCGVCRSGYAKKVFTKEGFDLVRCEIDGHLYVENAPSQEELDRFYDSSYFEGKAGGYRHNVFENPALHLMKAERKVKRVQRHLQSGKILDVGCGPGFFVFQARREGFNVFGCDASNAAVDYSQRVLGTHIWQGNFLDYPEGVKFDGVTMFSYIAHVINPGLSLRKAHGLLEDNGLLVLSIPNLASVGRVLKGKNWRGFSFPEHLQLFSHMNLDRILKENGFTPLQDLVRDNNFLMDTSYFFARKNGN